MRMSAEEMSPALVESGGEHIVSGIGAAPAAEMAVVRQQQADAILVSSAKGSNLTTVSSQPTATTVVAEGLATPPLPEEPLQGKELLEAIKKQVEFYFSRQNLQTDGFLVSQMNAHMCVPVAVIAQFHKIQQLTSDIGLIVESVKDSTVCAVTPDGIKPSIKQERNTIILREIPSETPEEKIRNLFTGEGVAPIRSIRSDVGDTWFVTMDSEDDAFSTILALRSKNFEGKSIKARLKSENILRSFFPVPTAAEVQPTAAAAAAAPYGMGGPPGSAGGVMPGMPYGMPGMGAPMMNGQPSYGYPGPGARGMFGNGGNMMMQGGPGGMRFGGMQHSGMVQQQGASGRGGGMMAPRGAGGMQMGGMGGMHGHQGHRMGQQHLGMGMNPKQLHQQQQQLQQQQQHQHQQQHHQQRPQQGDGRGEKKGSLRDAQQGVVAVGNGGMGLGHGYGQGQQQQRGAGVEGRGSDRPRKGDRTANTLQGRGEGGRGGAKTRNSTGRDMLSAANFPPLPGADSLAAATGAGAAGGVARSMPPGAPVVEDQVVAGSPRSEGGIEGSAVGAVPPAVAAAGYQGTFIQYQQDEILKIVSSLSQVDVAVVPGVEDIGQHSLVFEREANVGLLMRQRSVSIDECREQLRKGRPVHREGVIAGAVDYGSYMYGEGHEQGQGAGGGGNSRRGSVGHGNGESYSGGGGGGGDRKKGERGRRDKGERSSGSGPVGGGGGEDKAGGAEEKSSRGSRGGSSKNSGATAAPPAAHAAMVTPEPMGAYAAALLKKPAPQTQQQPPPQQQQSSSTKPSATSKSKSGGSSRERKGEGKTKDSSSGGGGGGSSREASASASSGNAGVSSSSAAQDNAVDGVVASGIVVGPGASKSREVIVKGGGGEGQGKDGVSVSASSGSSATAPRPTRGWEKPEVLQQQQQQQPQQQHKRGWMGESSRGSKGNTSKNTPTAANIASDDKRSSSSASSTAVFVSGDEGGDVLSSSSGAGVSAEGSTEGRHSDRVQAGPKEASTASEGDGVDSSSSSNAAAEVQKEGANVSRWGGKKSFLDVVKAPGNPPPSAVVAAKPAPQPTNKRAENLKSPGRRGRLERDGNARSPMRSGGAKGGERDKDNNRERGGGDRDNNRDRGGGDRDNKSRHHHHHNESSRMSNGRPGGADRERGGGREKGTWV